MTFSLVMLSITLPQVLTEVSVKAFKTPVPGKSLFNKSYRPTQKGLKTYHTTDNLKPNPKLSVSEW